VVETGLCVPAYSKWSVGDDLYKGSAAAQKTARNARRLKRRSCARKAPILRGKHQSCGPETAFRKGPARAGTQCRIATPPRDNRQRNRPQPEYVELPFLINEQARTFRRVTRHIATFTSQATTNDALYFFALRIIAVPAFAGCI
jgi:hypothetical protein